MAWARLNPFVYFAVAVVVFAVADLGIGLGSITKDPFSVDTGFFSVAAGRRARALQSIVHRPVAIVVFAVAAFGLRGWSRTTDPFSALTELDARTTCVGAGLDKVVVDLPVAIVVFAVADLGFGLERNCAAGCGKAVWSAHQHTIVATSSDPCLAYCTERGEVFVDLPVAIVVFAVAGLGGGGACGGATACPFSVGPTDLCSLTRTFADSDATRFAQIRERLIDLPVAIVVESIADLLGGVVNDRIHRTFELSRVVRKIVGDTARDIWVTTLCPPKTRHLGQAVLGGCVDPRTKTDHISLDLIDVSFGVFECISPRPLVHIVDHIGRVDASVGGRAVRQKQEVCGATFYAVLVDHGLEVIAGGGERTLVVGAVRKNAGRQLGRHLGRIGDDRGLKGCVFAEGHQPKTRLSIVVLRRSSAVLVRHFFEGVLCDIPARINALATGIARIIVARRRPGCGLVRVGHGGARGFVGASLAYDLVVVAHAVGGIDDDHQVGRLAVGRLLRPRL